jgi:hypothetical protein
MRGVVSPSWGIRLRNDECESPQGMISMGCSIGQRGWAPYLKARTSSKSAVALNRSFSRRFCLMWLSRRLRARTSGEVSKHAGADFFLDKGVRLYSPRFCWAYLNAILLRVSEV